jgi:hypothetical protein
MCDGGHCEGGRDDQQRAHDRDPAEVPLDRPQRSGEALPEEHHRQEDEEHHLGIQLDLAQLREEPERESDEEQQQRRGHPQPWREHGTGEDHGPECHDGLESVHGCSSDPCRSRSGV